MLQKRFGNLLEEDMFLALLLLLHLFNVEGKHFLVETEDDTKESSPDTLQDYVLSKEEVKAEMDKLIKSKAVFVVGKSYCPYTKKAKQVLKYGKKYEPI